MKKESLISKKPTRVLPPPGRQKQKGLCEVKALPEKKIPPKEEWDLSGNIPYEELDAAVIYELGRLKIQLTPELKDRIECFHMEIGYGPDDPKVNLIKCIQELTTTRGTFVFHPDTENELIHTPWINLNHKAKKRLTKAVRHEGQTNPSIILSDLYTRDAIYHVSQRDNKPIDSDWPKFIAYDWHNLFLHFSEDIELTEKRLSGGSSFMFFGFVAIDFNQSNKRILLEMEKQLVQEREFLRTEIADLRGKTRYDIKEMNLKRITAARLLSVWKMSFKNADKFYAETNRLKKPLFLNDGGTEWSKANKGAISLCGTIFRKS